MFRCILIMTCVLLLWLPLMGQSQRDSLVVSLLTCDPGPEVYELCGHEAIRIRRADAPMPAAWLANPGAELDSVWNYGTFDFAQPNFIYRFVKGETDYMVSSYPTWMFLREYEMQGRKVTEQELRLSQAEAHDLLGMLRSNALPENRTYRYNYVKDNCATRITSMLDKASARRIVYPDSINHGTFRRAMRAYHKDYPWYQFGIDLALGSGIDYPISGREEMFVPMEMRDKSAAAHFDDGTPLVTATRVLVPGTPDATLGPTPWWRTPLTVSWLWFAVMAIVCLRCVLKHREPVAIRVLYSLWFTLLGVAGCVVAFLVFVSEHEATAPNLLLLWLNPLQLILAVGVWFRRSLRAPTLAMAYVDIIILTILLIVWPMQAQSANAAFFPLMCITLFMAICYAILHTKQSYTYNEEVGNLGAGFVSGDKRPRTSRGRTAKTGRRNSR